MTESPASPSPQSGDGKDKLSLLPTELAKTLFALLPSFSSVFSLAATCRRLHSVWTTNANQIYLQMAPTCIPCERHARKLFAVQSRQAADASLSPQDVACLVENSNTVERALLQFEKEIACNVRANLSQLEEFYGPETKQHPPNLTPSERHRFIRSYYQIWTLMSVDPDEWPSMLQGLTLKRLYLLQEMCGLPSGNSKAAIIRPAAEDVDTNEVQKRENLQVCINKHLQDLSQRVHGTGADFPANYAMEGGYYTFILVWDHWQPEFKQLVCGRTQPGPNRPAEPRRAGMQPWAYDKIDQWDDSSDEE